MAVSLKDVANKLGLSPTTVSLVLNNKPNKISKATKELIWQTARELNYYPNQLAASLSSGKTRTIGLILPVLDSFYSELARGVDDVVSQEGYTLMLGCTNNNPERSIEVLRTIASHVVEGIIIARCNAPKPEEEDVIRSLSIPCIGATREMPTGFGSVLVDQELGSELAARHFIEMNHRNIACISGPYPNPMEHGRVRSFFNELQNHGIDISESDLFLGDYTFEGGYRAAEEIIAANRYTAIFSCNDNMACGVCRAYRDHGMSIPKDVSLIGFDDIYFTGLLETPLTSINQSTFEIGQSSANMLLKKIREPSTPNVRMIFQPTLEIRGSTRKL